MPFGLRCTQRGAARIWPGALRPFLVSRRSAFDTGRFSNNRVRSRSGVAACGDGVPLMSHRVGFLLLAMACVGTCVRADSIAFSVNLIVNSENATSIGHATYDPGFCLDCRFRGNHRINGGSASYNWDLPQNELYEREITQTVRDAACYTGFI